MDRGNTRLTPRGSGALIGGLLVLLLALFSANLVLLVVATFLLGFVLAELLVFALMTRGFAVDSFSLERVECSELVAVGGAGLVALRATSRMSSGFYAEVHDRVPGALPVVEGDSRLVSWWDAGARVSLAYVVSPAQRGVFPIGPVDIVAHDPLGFAFRSLRLEAPWTVESIIDSSSVLPGHPARLASPIVGQTSLSARGAGSDFRGLRDYAPSDEIRHIAWTRSTRGALLVREFERESQQDLVALVDVGKGMASGLEYATALEEALAAAARVLRIAFDEGGRAGVLLYGARVVAYVPPGRGSNHEFRVFRELTGAELGPSTPSLATALEYLRVHLERPTTLFAFGGLTEDGRKLAAATAAVRSAGHRLYALVPEPGRMYPEIADPARRAAFELIVDPETRRARAAGASLEAAGAAVEFFGRGDAVGAVAALYARQAGAGRSP
jgi:uncharacterized protein (DUF58 family)